MRFIHRALGASALFGIAALSGCDDYCNTGLCLTRVKTALFIARVPSALDGAAIQICRNGSCVEGVLRFELILDEEGNQTGSRVTCDVAEGHSCNGTLSGSSATVLLVASYPGEGEGEVEIEDGDVYSATVTAPEDAELVLASRKAPVAYLKNESYCDTDCYAAEY